ncbi:MAG: hypothetical protein Q8941_19985 [Bacteroidota bacterium]|nr:hypothetical protein [Bacteroidota bacterium]
MRFRFLFFISLLAGIPGYSQKQFEGTIVYNLHASQESEDAQLAILFGKNAVKLKMTEKNAPGKDELIIRLDLGELYTLDFGEKTFHARNLIEKKKADSGLSAKKIAGFMATPITLSDIPLMSVIAMLSRGGDPVIYVADSLFYFIPEKYSSNPELIFSHGGKITLGMEIKGNNSLSENDENNRQGADITIEATSVKWETFNDDEFSIPADFIKQYSPITDDSARSVDSTLKIMADTTQGPQTKPVKQSPANTKQPAKPKTKTNNTKTGAMRKPE